MSLICSSSNSSLVHYLNVKENRTPQTTGAKETPKGENAAEVPVINWRYLEVVTIAINRLFRIERIHQLFQHGDAEFMDK